MRADRPSATARLIAAATVLVDLDGDLPGVVPEGSAAWSALLLALSRADRMLLASVRHRVGRAFWRAVERGTLPGIRFHFQLRKRWLDRVARRAIADGFGQIVVLGAGLDTLCLRLASEGAAARLVEVDHPSTQSFKHRLLAAGPGMAPRIVLAPHDLSEGTLPAGVIDTRPDTLVIAEGLLMYLRPETVAGLLAELGALGCPRLRFAMTFMDRRPSGPAGFRPHSRLVDAWLRWRGERFLWALPREELRTFLAGRGWLLRELLTAPDLREAAGMVGVATPDGECAALADAANPPV